MKTPATMPTDPVARLDAGWWPVLSVSQPYAWALIHAGKDCENRRWKTTYTGPVWIHAPKSIDKRPLPDGYAVPEGFDLATGAVVGMTIVTGIVRGHESVWSWGPDTPDGAPLYQWLVEEPCALAEPVPAKGRQKLWWPTAEQTAAFHAQLPAPRRAA